MSPKSHFNHRGGLRRSTRLKNLFNGAKIPRRSARILGMKSLSINFRVRKKMPDPRTTRNVDKSLMQGSMELSTITGRDCWKNGELSKLDGDIAMSKTQFCSSMEFSLNGCREDGKPSTASYFPENFIGKGELNGGSYSLIKAKKRYRCEGKYKIRKMNLDNGKNVQYYMNDSATADGWTEDQELSLQNAYFWARPSPHFWKRVSKLVDGKSEQDCFDKIQSDYSTPIQHPGKPRINGKDVPSKAIAVDDLLKPNSHKCSQFSKNKSLLRCKTVRYLMKKHYIENKYGEADLFSILEDDSRIENEIIQLEETSVQAEQKMENIKDGGSSIFRSSPGMVVVMEGGDSVGSPEVLKEMKDWGLHERYVARLQSREATRMASRIINVGSSPPYSVGYDELGRADVVKVAKNSLVSTVQDATHFFDIQQATYYCHNDHDFTEDYV